MRWRKVLFNRSIWLVCPDSLPTSVCVFRQAIVVSPKIAETQASLIIVGKFPPESLATFHTSITDKESEDLPRPPTLNNPNTDLKDLDGNKGKDFIHFQNIICLCRKVGHFF
jgi:hypothetical protein